MIHQQSFPDCTNIKPRERKKQTKRYPRNLVPCEICGKMLVAGERILIFSFIYQKINICLLFSIKGAIMETHFLASHEAETYGQVPAKPKGPKKIAKPWSNSNALVKCQVCGEEKRRAHIRKHLISHLPYHVRLCPLCPVNRQKTNSLKHHIIKHHPENYEPVNQFICTKCNEREVFGSIDELRSHMEDIHNIKQTPAQKRIAGRVIIDEEELSKLRSDIGCYKKRSKEMPESTDFEMEITSLNA